MKAICTSLLLLFCLAFTAQAQTLQFSGVVLVTSNQSVPSGKVWKVESVLSNEVRLPTSGSTLPSNSRFITVNGNPTCVYEVFVNAAGLGFNSCCGGGSWLSNTGQSANSTPTSFATIDRENLKLPLWLPAGATLGPGTNVHTISVIEFNVIP